MPKSSATSIDENIRVFIRQRPATREDQEALSDILDDEDEPGPIQSLELNAEGDCALIAPTNVMGQSQKKESFKFSGGFLPGSTQQDVFEQAAQPIVDSALKGYSGTIFAYGPTNSGKTYTMRGTNNSGERGVMERCIDQLLAASRESNVELWASYLQIYCEMITDLLDVNGDSAGDTTSGYLNSGAGNLTIREKEGRVYVEGLQRVALKSKQDFQDVLAHGDKNKVMAETNMNAASSRSHTALMITITIPDDDSVVTMDTNSAKRPYKAYKESTLFLVDLAGSERASASAGHQFQRIEESKAINLSLSSLGNCMNALAERRTHVPYRDSKLTRLLQGSLGGGSRTSVIVTIPPIDRHSDKLLAGVLRFASRAMVVKVKAKVGRFVDYESLYNAAMKKIDSIEDSKNASLINVSINEDMQDKVERQADEIAALKEELSLLKAQTESQQTVSQPSPVDGYDPSFGSRTGVLAKSSDPIAMEKHWREQMQATTDKAMSDMKSSRQKFEAKIRTLNRTIDNAASEVLGLQNDLTEERTAHLATVQQVKSYQQKLTKAESELETRVEELLTDRNELFEELERERSNALKLEEKVAAMQSEILKSRADKEEMVPISQFTELETLFTETVERITARVIELEERKASTPADVNVRSRGNSGGDVKYGLSVGGDSMNSKRIQPGGRVIRGAPQARSRW